MLCCSTFGRRLRLSVDPLERRVGGPVGHVCILRQGAISVNSNVAWGLPKGGASLQRRLFLIYT